MVAIPPIGSRLVLPLQLIGATAAFLLLALAPGPRGSYALLSFGQQSAAARIALANGALLLGRGRGATPIVRGERDALFLPLLRAGVLVVAARDSSCGARA